MISTGSPISPPAASYSFLPYGISMPATMNRAGCMPITTAIGQGSPRSCHLRMIRLPCLPFDVITDATFLSCTWMR